MGNYLDVINGFDFWLACLPVLGMVTIQSIIFSKRAFKSAELVGLEQEDAKKAFRVGAVSAIGPAMGVFVVMLGLMSAIGGPLSWMRLAIIGAAPTELAAATQAANAMNVELGGKGYGLFEFSNAAWVMALNGSAWLLTSGLFSHKLDKVTNKISGGSSAKLGVISIAAMCGSFAFLFGQELIKGLDVEKRPYLVSGVAAGISMLILEKIAKKYPKLTEYNLGFSMIIGMFAAVAYSHIIK